jgi:aspartyl-tRNA(Asn)/glutamyl-tRNA(Gln) amidotransferase subunit A
MSDSRQDETARFPARAAVEHCLANIERLNPSLNAMITTVAETAREAADACDRAAAEGRWLGLLHGLPIALKDNIETAGVRTTSGATYLADHIPNEDAPVVVRLKAQGAVLVGKANMQELAWGVVSTNPVVGQCRNPWNPDYIPGGSSGGSGAAVAAEMAEASLGTDTGGSVRLPASMTGVSGLRPTHGRISIRGVTPLSVTHDTIGPMARRVDDVARLFAALAGYDRLDPVSRDMPLENFLPHLGDGIRGVRVGLARNFFFDDVDPEIDAAVRKGAATLEALGATLVDVTLAGAETAQRWTTIMAYADTCAYHKERLDAGPDALSEPVYTRMMLGRDFTAVDYAEAMRGREAWRRTLKEVFETVDILLAPTTPKPVPPIADDRSLHRATQDATRFTYGGALASIPGLSVPCGFTSSGLPIGMMLEAAWGAEPLLFRAGHAYQQATDWHTRRAPCLDAG